MLFKQQTMIHKKMKWRVKRLSVVNLTWYVTVADYLQTFSYQGTILDQYNNLLS